MRNDPKEPPADLSTVDIVSIVLLLITMVVFWIGAANDNQLLIWTANLAIGVPAAVMKVRSSRAKSRWWYEHGEAWRARQKEKQPQN